MANENEIDHTSPRVTRFGTITKTAMDSINFRENGIWSVDAATGRTVRLFAWAAAPAPLKAMITALAERHRDKMEEPETPI